MVVIKANIEENGLGDWLIRVYDSFEESTVFCNDVDEFSQNIEEIGEKYKGKIEIEWSKDENVTPEHFMQVQAQMSRYKEKLDNKEQ